MFDFSKLNFFNRLDARSRVFVLFGAVVGFIVLIYFGTQYFTSSSRPVGPSNVATVPSGLQSTPGGQTTSAYYQAVVQANEQREQQAQMSGGSAIATITNPATLANCNIICADKTANVKDLLDDWVRNGKLNPDTAQYLQDLANKNVSVDEYAAALDRLVKEGKLTPEQARELLAQYKKQHANALLQDSAKLMDDLIKSGQLPLDAANELLTAQKNGVSPAEYAAILQRLVKEGKISPETAQRLLAQYNQQKAKEAADKNAALIQDMARRGEITPDVAAQLQDLANRNVSADEYARALQNLVAQGKLTPAAAAKLLEAYKKTKMGSGVNSQIQALIKNAEEEAYAEVAQLLKEGKITASVATQILDMIHKDVSLQDFVSAIGQMVQEKQLSPTIAPLKIADYTKIKNLRDQAARLVALQNRNASPSEYADELKRAVAAGIITPDQASQMLADYQALTQAPSLPTVATGDGAFADLQNRVAESSQPAPASNTFTEDQLKAQQLAAQARRERLEAMTSAMQSQSGQLISAWAPPVMSHREGNHDTKTTTLTTATSGSSTQTTTTSTMTTTGIPLIKAGTIIFAVLDTEANSDYPDSPIMATIVDGQYKGSKLLGKLVTTKGVAGQMDRISLNFNLMNKDEWDKSRNVTAYAIDPDTARSVMASSVDYHYWLRYGAIFATSFIQGYANAIMNSGATVNSTPSGTTTTYAAFSPADKLAVAIGQIGQNLSTVTQNYINIPPTVKVNAGVSLGILFMSDVSA